MAHEVRSRAVALAVEHAVDRARDDAERRLRCRAWRAACRRRRRAEHRLPEVERLGALGEQTGELLVAREVRPVVVQDPDLGTVCRAQAHDATDHRLELLRTGTAFGDRGVLFREQLLVERPDDEVEDLRLRTEVRVEASRQHPARVGDVTGRRVARTPSRRSAPWRWPGPLRAAWRSGPAPCSSWGADRIQGTLETASKRLLASGHDDDSRRDRRRDPIRLSHPVIDIDGHTTESLVALEPYLRDEGVDPGQLVAAASPGRLRTVGRWYYASPAERAANRDRPAPRGGAPRRATPATSRPASARR